MYFNRFFIIFASEYIPKKYNTDIFFVGIALIFKQKKFGKKPNSFIYLIKFSFTDLTLFGLRAYILSGFERYRFQNKLRYTAEFPAMCLRLLQYSLLWFENSCP